jgi:hypothetical protein
MVALSLSPFHRLPHSALGIRLQISERHLPLRNHGYHDLRSAYSELQLCLDLANNLLQSRRLMHPIGIFCFSCWRWPAEEDSAPVWSHRPQPRQRYDHIQQA